MPRLEARESDKRLSLARQLLSEYVDSYKVTAAFVTGSTALERADCCSDLDMILVLQTPCSEQRFESERALAERSGGGFYHGSPEVGFGIYRMVDGIKCDVGITPVTRIEERLEQALVRFETDIEPQLILRGIRESIALHGCGLIEQWRERSEPYPEVLAYNMVEAYLKPLNIWSMKNLIAARSERLALNEYLLGAVRAFVAVVFGLNRQYHPGKLRGVRDTITRLRHKPRRFIQRCERLFRLQPMAQVDAMEQLSQEMIELVNLVMPEVDTHEVEENFRREFGPGQPNG